MHNIILLSNVCVISVCYVCQLEIHLMLLNFSESIVLLSVVYKNIFIWFSSYHASISKSEDLLFVNTYIWSIEDINNKAER